MSVGVARSKVGDSPSSVNVDHLPFYNPHITELEIKPAPVLAHDHGAGAACRVCGDACPGLDLHFWRKVCRACRCRKEDHAVPLGGPDPGHLRIGKLFGSAVAEQLASLHLAPADPAASGPARYGAHSLKTDVRGKAQALQASFASTASSMTSSATSSTTASSQTNTSNGHVGRTKKETTETGTEAYAWLPTDRQGLPIRDPATVAEYMRGLPAEERPIRGTEGAQQRAKALEHLWPWYDMDASRSRERGALSAEERGQLEAYMELAKTRHVGQAGLSRLGELAAQDGEDWPAPPPPLHSASSKSPASSPKSLSSDEASGSGGGGSAGSTGPGACQKCSEELGPAELVLTTSHTGAGRVWHPGCFACSECGQRLVDMLYFYKDGAFFCGRHFGERMFPRCFGCDELIFSREYTFAEEQNWHLNHFCCLGCDAELGGERYMVREEQPFCIPCYMERFARVCQACRAKIPPDAKRISHQDAHWHADDHCFACKTCKASLVGKRFLLKNHNLFCSPDCKDRHQRSQHH